MFKKMMDKRMADSEEMKKMQIQEKYIRPIKEETCIGGCHHCKERQLAATSTRKDS